MISKRKKWKVCSVRVYKYIRKICFFSILFLGIICMKNTVYAKQVYSQGSFYYQIEDEAISITGYFGTKEKVVVPAMIAGYPVSKIATGAFDNAESVKELHLPDTIMEIEKNAIAEHISVSYSEQPNHNTTDTTVDEVLDNSTEGNAEDSSIGKQNEDKGGKQETNDKQSVATLEEESFEVEEIEEIEEAEIVIPDLDANFDDADAEIGEISLEEGAAVIG